MAGDWNTVEEDNDKSSSNSQLIGPTEKRVFDQFKVALGIEDIFPNSNILRYSWNNQQQGANRKMARLNRIYIFQRLGSGDAVVDYRILGNCYHSDHFPVWCRL